MNEFDEEYDQEENEPKKKKFNVFGWFPANATLVHAHSPFTKTRSTDHKRKSKLPLRQ